MSALERLVYLDASVLVPLFTDDAFSTRADRVLRNGVWHAIVSDYATAEFSSAVARRVRTKELSISEAHDAFSDFDVWISRAHRVEAQPTDISHAATFIRRLDLPLRTPDALHIAIARRMGASLVTFDDGMASAARALGVAVESA